MGEIKSWPWIDPTSFDLIVIGTGLPESVFAAAATNVGKSVLHIDPNPFYGSHFSSLSVNELPDFLESQGIITCSSSPSQQNSDFSDSDYILACLHTRHVYSHTEVYSNSYDQIDCSHKFILDLAGPRVLFCSDSTVGLLLKSGASQYIDFKGVEGSFVRGDDGRLSGVPDSRAAIFKDRLLSLTEKNQLMRFFKLVQEHLTSDVFDSSKNSVISDDDMETPFIEFLSKLRLPQKIKSVILYAIAMADYEQDTICDCREIIKTKDGINRLLFYQSSIGRLENAAGAFIYPVYGQGELSQAFCRRAAVKGCIYVLRMPVVALLLDKEYGQYRGIKLATGQNLLSQKLVIDPSFRIAKSSISSRSMDLVRDVHDHIFKKAEGKVARAICISKGSLVADKSNILVVYPPKSLYSEQVTSVRVLQLGSSLAVCPVGMCVVYISTLCDGVDDGKKLIVATINDLFESRSCTDDTEKGNGKPPLLWSVVYIQDQIMGCFYEELIGVTPMPDGSMNHDRILDETKKLFNHMFPGEEYFPASEDELEQNGGSS